MKRIKAGLIGFGTVGTGVVKAFERNREILEQRLGAAVELKRIVSRDIERPRGVEVAPGLLSTDVQSILRDPEIELVIELMGGYEPARTYILEAIAQGKDVVTANKALLALHGPEIFEAAKKAGVDVFYEAAVAGAIPVITAIRENLCINRFQSLFGILNGTCNYILTRMTDEGADFSEVLKDAQAQGYAEADPTFDVEGIDTAHKLSVLISLCFGTPVDFDRIYIEGISRITALDIQFAKEFGYKIKLLAICKEEGGRIEARVHPTMLTQGHPLTDVDGVFNAVRIVGDFSGPIMLSGRGAGMDATASAVMGDVMSCVRNRVTGSSGRAPARGYRCEAIRSLPIKPMDEVVSQYYLRFMVNDRPGVLAKIAGILGDRRIGIASMIQPERHQEDSVPVVLLTHEAVEADVRCALAAIDALEVIREPSRFIRIEASLD